MTDYPEHEKLAAISDQSQLIGEFLDTGDWVLCRWNDEWHEHRPIKINDALAEWFEIDAEAIAREKEAMLAALREKAKV